MRKDGDSKDGVRSVSEKLDSKDDDCRIGRVELVSHTLGMSHCQQGC